MKIAVIGAGPAGLAAAWELKNQALSVDVFEAHSKPGGCASYFRRPLVGRTNPLGHPDQNVGSPVPKVLFDAGATVLWGLREGEFFNLLLKKWGVQLAPFSTHLTHRFYLNNRSFELDCRNEETWITSLIKNFPQDKDFIQKKFPTFFKIAKLLNRILYKVPAEPFLSLDAILENSKLIPEALELCRYFVQIPRSFSKLLAKSSDEFQEWANSLLLITLQARASEVESLYGISALCFVPLGTGSLQGGMASLFDALAQQFPSNNCKINFRSPIHKICFNTGYEIHSKDKIHYGYSHVLLSIPRWNSESLFEEKLFENSESLQWQNIKDKLWSAIVCYFVFEDHPSLPDSAFNHLVKSTDGEFYFSVSARGDTQRGPAHVRVATASSHERLDRWEYTQYLKKKPFEGRDLYEKQKKHWEDSFTRAASHVFSTTPLLSEIASPKTFYTYTLRKDGFVGGIPLIKAFSFLKSPSQETLLPNVIQLGDTAFPGQSVVNCSIGALEAVRKIVKSL